MVIRSFSRISKPTERDGAYHISRNCILLHNVLFHAQPDKIWVEKLIQRLGRDSLYPCARTRIFPREGGCGGPFPLPSFALEN